MGTKNRIRVGPIHIRDMAREAILQGFLYKVRIKLVAAVCTLPLVKDCSARGRKVGK